MLPNQIKTNKYDRANAERAAEWFCIEHLKCVETRRAIKTKFFKVDLFGADVMGKFSDGSMAWVQVTAGQDSAVSARRRKLEIHAWQDNDRIYLLQLKKFKIGTKRAEFKFKLFEYKQDFYHDTNSNSFVAVDSRYWLAAYELVDVPQHWFKAYKSK